MRPLRSPHADDESPAPGGDPSLFADLIARCRVQEDALAALAHDAAAILARHEAAARDAADGILIEARIEAARLLTEARREVSALSAQAELLRQAQREAAQALQQTRRALDGALGIANVREIPPAPVLLATHGTTHAALVAPPALRPRSGVPAGLLPPRRSTGGTRIVLPSTLTRQFWVAAGAAAAVALLAAAFITMLPAGEPSRGPIASGRAPAGPGEAAAPAEPTGRPTVAAAAAGATRAKPRTAGARVPARQGRAAREGGEKGASTAAAVKRAPSRRTPDAAPDAAPAGTAATTGTASPARAVGTPVSLETPPARPDASGGSTAEEQILAADRQWFDAYYRGDQAAMGRLTTTGFALADARGAAQKARPGSPPHRVLQDVRVDVHGDGAVLSGRMIERGGEGREHESFLSEVWVRREGRWRLLGVRLASRDEVRQAAEALAPK